MTIILLLHANDVSVSILDVIFSVHLEKTEMQTPIL